MPEIATLQIPTHKGMLRYEKYPDGEVLAGLEGGGWYSLDTAAQRRLGVFLLGGEHGIKPVAATRSKAPVKEPEGWAVYVAEGKRYFYAKRDQARLASVSHKLGENGRIR